jgi:SAM-dependent methyltransferase
MSRHWPEVAHRWKQIGPPLRPVAEDVASFERAVHLFALEKGAPRALILGVTPELYSLGWPVGSDVHAVDHTPAMIEVVWPGPREAVSCSEWTEVPFPDGSRDIALCDGGLHLLSYPSGQRALAKELERVLAPGGLFAIRLFLPPAKRESAQQVLDDFLGARVANLNELKLRLGPALTESAESGVELDGIWRAVHAVAPDLDRVAERLGWTREHLGAIETYRGSHVRYHFVTLAEVTRLFCTEGSGFELLSKHEPSYPLGERCPIVVLRRKP